MRKQNTFRTWVGIYSFSSDWSYLGGQPPPLPLLTPKRDYRLQGAVERTATVSLKNVTRIATSADVRTVASTYKDYLRNLNMGRQGHANSLAGQPTFIDADSGKVLTP